MTKKKNLRKLSFKFRKEDWGKKKIHWDEQRKKNKGGGKKNKGEEKLHFVGYKFEYAVLPGILFGPPAAVCEIFFSLKHYPENSNIQ